LSAFAGISLSRAAALSDVVYEREQQDEKYGGVEHDDLHNPNDWIVLVTRYASDAAARPACNDDWTEDDAARFRKNMVRAAALAVAAIEYIDRQALKS
jgi:hypothetical protein